MGDIRIIYRLVAIGHGGKPALAHCSEPRIGRAAVATMLLPVHADLFVHRNVDFPAQSIEREALDQFLGKLRFAVEQELSVACRPDDHVEQRLALRSQQAGIDRQFLLHIVGQQSLEKIDDAFAIVLRGEADDRAVGQAGSCHG